MTVDLGLIHQGGGGRSLFALGGRNYLSRPRAPRGRLNPARVVFPGVGVEVFQVEHHASSPDSASSQRDRRRRPGPVIRFPPDPLATPMPGKRQRSTEFVLATQGRQVNREASGVAPRPRRIAAGTKTNSAAVGHVIAACSGARIRGIPRGDRCGNEIRHGELPAPMSISRKAASSITDSASSVQIP